MCQLIETIRVNNNRFRNLEYHDRRLNNARRILFGCKSDIPLVEHLTLPPNLDDKTYKCRIEYSKDIHGIEFLPYTPKKIKKLKLVECNFIDYSFKYRNREIFEKLLLQRDECDEILIVKNGKITDTSFTNIVFQTKTGSWVTPARPLLKGTMREYLLDHNLIFLSDIGISDLKHFKKAMLINSMLGFDKSFTIEINNIVS